MMKNYLFKTCRGQFNWNKLIKKKCISLFVLTYMYRNACFKECEVHNYTSLARQRSGDRWQFLGTCNYYCQFILSYADYVAPLLPSLTKSNWWR